MTGGGRITAGQRRRSADLLSDLIVELADLLDLVDQLLPADQRRLAAELADAAADLAARAGMLRTVRPDGTEA